MVHMFRVSVKLPLSAPEAEVTSGLAGRAFLSWGQVELAISTGAQLVHSLFGVGGTCRCPLQRVHSTTKGNVSQSDSVGI